MALTLVLVMPQCAQAAPHVALTPEQAASIYVVAYGQYHGPREWLDRPPMLHVISPEQLCADLGRQPGCAVKGYYVPGIVRILNLDFSDVYNATILLHEFIHHFQFLKTGKVAADCDENLAREREAYTIQVHVLERAQEYTHARGLRVTMASLSCS